MNDEPEITTPPEVVDAVIDLDNLPKQEHVWIKRGIKISCEGANHPHHSHFLVG